MRVEEVMTSSVRTCLPTDTLDVVMQAMWDQDLGALPVVDAAGRPIAVITDRDVAVAAFMQGQPLQQLQVRSSMSKGIITAHAQDRLSSAERTMRVHQLHRLPVVDDSSRLVGILSLNDIARIRASANTRVAEQRDLVITMAAIAQKRGPLTVEEYALKQMVSFETLSPPKRAKVISRQKRVRAPSATPTESGVFPTVAVSSLADIDAVSSAS